MSQKSPTPLRSLIKTAVAIIGASAMLLVGGVSAQGVSAPQKAVSSAPPLERGMAWFNEQIPNTIEGNVQDWDGDPAIGMFVQLVNGQGSVYRSAQTDDQGHFSFSELPAGDYKLRFVGDENYENQWFDEKFSQSSARVLTVTDSVGWSVGANVRKIGGGAEDLEIRANFHNPQWDNVADVDVHLFDASLEEVDTQLSDDDGNVLFSGLKAGSYTLCYEADGFDYVCLDTATDVESANFFWLDEFESADFNLVMRNFGTVSGLVTGPNGSPMGNAQVFFYPIDSDGQLAMWDGFSTTTDENGLYETRVGEGSVKAVAAPADSDSPLVPQWWDGVSSSNNAPRITVSGDTPQEDVNFELRKEGSSVGVNVWCGSTGTECEDQPFVEIVSLDGTLAEYSKVGFGSEVVITGLSAGRYVISANNFWLGGDGTFEDASVFTVGDGEDIRGITHVFPANADGATVSGRVRIAGGGDAAAYTVRLSTMRPWGLDIEAEAETDDEGNYEFAGVKPGSYTLSFSEPASCGEFDCVEGVTDYWGNVYSEDSSEFFDLHSGDDFTADFTTLPRTSRITGTVKNGAVALGDVEVTIIGPNGSATVTTATNGTYTASGLAPGVYRAVARKEGFVGNDEYYPTYAKPSATVAAGATGTINVTLIPAAARISGKVTGSDASTLGLSNMSVVAIRKSDGYCAAFGRTDTSGNYTLTGLAAGSYAVWAGSEMAEGCGWYNGSSETSPYIGEFLTDKPNLAAATAIALTATQTLTNQNFVLQKGASISGSVTLKDPTRGFAGISVKAYGTNNIVVKVRNVNADGTFSLEGLPAGVYTLKFEADDLSDTWYEDSSGARRMVSLAAAQALANVSVTMDGVAVISGSIKSTTGTAVPGRVEAVDSNGGVVASTVRTTDSATYSLKVPAGMPVRLRAIVTGQEFWLGGASSMLTSPWISGNAGSPVTVRDIITASPSQITGRVTESGKVKVYGWFDPREIQLLDAAGQTVASTRPGADGTYSFTGVMPGTYTIFARTSQQAAIFYGNKDSIATASYITVLGGAALEGIDIDATAPTSNFMPGTIVLSGVPKVGTAMSVAMGTWTPAPSSIMYRWYVEEPTIWQPIPKAVGTAASYTISPNDQGKILYLYVYVLKNGVTTEQMWIPCGVVAGLPLTASPVPTITGTAAAKVGTVLTAVPGTWTPAPVTVSYQWMKAGEPIPGATAATYTPTAADAGARLTVRTVGTKAGSITVLKESVQTSAVALQALTTSPIPTVTGTARVGSLLTANTTAWAPAPVGITYQWKRGGTDIPGATGSTYLLTAEDQTRTITVATTGSKVGFASVTKTSVATAAVAAPPAATFTTTPTPTISGTARIDSVLTVTPGTWAPVPDTRTIQWLRNGVPIAGANDVTYKLTLADVGKTVRVSVKGTKATFASVTKLSAATATIATGEIDITNAEGLFGDVAEIGREVTIELNGVAPADVIVRYQWLRDGEPIRGARRATYVPTARDLGRQISVKFELSKPGYTTKYFTVEGYVRPVYQTPN